MCRAIFFSRDRESLLCVAEFFACMQKRHAWKFEETAFILVDEPCFRDGAFIGYLNADLPSFSDLYLINFPLDVTDEVVASNLLRALLEEGNRILGLISNNNFSTGNWESVIKRVGAIQLFKEYFIPDADNPWHAFNLAFEDEGREIDGEKSRARRDAANRLAERQSLNGSIYEFVQGLTILHNSSEAGQRIVGKYLKLIEILATYPFESVVSALLQMHRSINS